MPFSSTLLTARPACTRDWTTLFASSDRRLSSTTLNTTVNAASIRATAATAANTSLCFRPNLLISSQPVADAVHRDDRVLVAELAQLAADPRDVRVERVVVDDCAVG